MPETQGVRAMQEMAKVVLRSDYHPSQAIRTHAERVCLVAWRWYYLDNNVWARRTADGYDFRSC